MKTLKNVLVINALSSGVTGLGLAVMPGVFADLFNASVRAPFVATGLFLLVFAAIVFIESRRPFNSPSWVRFIIALDSLWVFVSAVIIVFQALDISVLGYFIIGAVAVWVGLMASLQYIGLKQMIAAR